MASQNPAPHAAKAAPAPFRLSARSRARFAAALALAASATTLWADGRVSGRVTDAATQSGLPGAEITVVGSSARAITASDGSFTLNLPAGEYELTSFYLGYPSQTVSVTVTDGATVPARFALGSSDDVITLDAFVVEGTREGQARALNQQRTSLNLTNIISSDLSGQFPDKTIADAVKRLPGVTVETDADTGGSEGRYITIRGMNADFNAVSVNGMRVAVSDFSGLSRRVPLDVVSAKSADQIEVTKALRPDQDGDGIGGYVNIVTRGPFDRDGTYAFVEGAIGYSALLSEYKGGYPYDNPSYEASAGYSTTFGAENQFGISVSGNMRERAFAKQRISTQGWAADGGPGGIYYPIGVGLQDFFDDVFATGLNTTFEWRPNENNKLRFDLSYSNRETERGRQRLVAGFTNAGIGADLNGDGNYDTYTTNANALNNFSAGRLNRNVRQFFEEQQIINAVLRGETIAGPWTFDYFTGFNSGTFDGNADKDISATFRTGSFAKTYTAGGYFPGLGGALYDARFDDPTRYFFNALDRGTSFVDDQEWAGGFDAKRDLDLFGGSGIIKAGVKTRLFSRDYDFRARRMVLNVANDWDLSEFFGQPDIGSSVANYGDPRIVDNRYDLGFYVDPTLVRLYANRLEADGRLIGRADNALSSRAQSYQADENIFATYLLTQQTWDKFTAMAGTRVEFTNVEFNGFDATTNPGNGQIATITSYSRDNDYVNVLPGLHLKYEQTRNLIYRFAVTRSIARPRLSDINPSIRVDPFGEDAFSQPGGFIATVDRGNINLKPTTSTNFDLGLEYYFGSASSFSAGFFYKDMRNNVYRGYDFNDPAFPNTLVRTSLNAKSAWVRGFEIGYDQQFTFLPAPFDGLGVFANYTFADSEVDTGVPQFANTKLPLFNQVEHTINAGLFYEKSGFRARAALLYRSESLLGLSIDEDFRDYDPNLSRYSAPSTTLDLTASYRFAKNWQVFVEFQNVLDTPGRAYIGNTSRLDFNEYTDWSGNIGLRWSL